MRSLLFTFSFSDILSTATCYAQAEKVVNHNGMSWFSINNVVKFSDKWGPVIHESGD